MHDLHLGASGRVWGESEQLFLGGRSAGRRRFNDSPRRVFSADRCTREGLSATRGVMMGQWFEMGPQITVPIVPSVYCVPSYLIFLSPAPGP